MIRVVNKDLNTSYERAVFGLETNGPHVDVHVIRDHLGNGIDQAYVVDAIEDKEHFELNGCLG